MIPKRKIKAQFLRHDSSLTSGRDDKPSFQLLMLRAFLLPPACRDVFLLRDIQGYSLPEVAAALGISKDDVTKHLRRARREMQTS
jgi:RNA polymerase sigma factor (sigma-70 family)